MTGARTMRSKKHVLELFTKEDPWPIRLTVMVIWLTFLLGLAVLLKESTASLWALLFKRLL
jgi:hypothetical protein